METLTSIRLNYQHLLDKPRVYADLNVGWRVGDNYIISLSSHATESDLRQLGHPLTPGLVVNFWTDDGDDAGNPDPLLFQGTIQFDEDTQNWVARVVWNDFHNASDYPVDNPTPVTRPTIIDGFAKYTEVRNTSPRKSAAAGARSRKKP